MTITIKKNNGEVVTLKIEAKHPSVKTTVKGKTYTLFALIKLAETGELTTKELAENAALVGITQARAVEMIEDSVRQKSGFLIVTPQ